MSTEQPQAERGATLTHAVPHPATKGPGLLQPGPRGQVEGASHARGPDSAGRWSALPVGNSELPPAAAAGGKTESPPPGPGVPAALPAAAAPRPPSSWSGCQLPTQQPSGPARHRQGRREEEGGAGAHFAGTGEKGRAGPQTAEGLQGCGRGRPGQKGPRDLAVDVSVLTGQCWPSAGRAPAKRLHLLVGDAVIRQQELEATPLPQDFTELPRRAPKMWPSRLQPRPGQN